MTRNILIFGTVLGAILATNVVVMMTKVTNNPEIETNDILGYAAMVVVFSLTFFGIRNYRNKELNGFISFKLAFQTGALIALVGSTIYVVVGLLYYYLFVPNFLDQYAAHVLIDAARHGASEADLANKTEQMDQLKEMYKNPLFVVLLSYAEVLPVGLIVALVSSFILKKTPQSV